MSRSDVHHHSATAEGAAVGIVVTLALFGAILVAPGALLVFGLDRLIGLELDCAQLWTFAAVASVAVLGGLATAARSFATGFWRYFVMALAVAALLLVARFGVHASWPRELWRAFTGVG